MINIRPYKPGKYCTHENLMKSTTSEIEQRVFTPPTLVSSITPMKPTLEWRTLLQNLSCLTDKKTCRAVWFSHEYNHIISVMEMKYLHHLRLVLSLVLVFSFVWMRMRTTLIAMTKWQGRRQSNPRHFKNYITIIWLFPWFPASQVLQMIRR